MSPDDLRRVDEQASEWMHRGMDLARSHGPAALEEAVRCFDQAIDLRRTLPLEKNASFRYGLSAGWINRADALAGLGAHRFPEALQSYDEALTLLQTLPPEESPLYPRRLAIAWINRGAALSRQDLPQYRPGAVESFRHAIEVLEQPAAVKISDQSSLLAGAWTNLAAALINWPEAEVSDVRAAARQAIVLARDHEQGDAAWADMGLKARHALACVTVREILRKRSVTAEDIAEATDAVEDGLALALRWKIDGSPEFATLARALFRFGCRLYEHSQPQFLAEYLLEHLDRELGGPKYLLDRETLDAVRKSIWDVFEKLQQGGYQFVTGEKRDAMLASIERLREVEQRLWMVSMQGGGA